MCLYIFTHCWCNDATAETATKNVHKSSHDSHTVSDNNMLHVGAHHATAIHHSSSVSCLTYTVTRTTTVHNRKRLIDVQNHLSNRYEMPNHVCICCSIYVYAQYHMLHEHTYVSNQSIKNDSNPCWYNIYIILYVYTHVKCKIHMYFVFTKQIYRVHL